MERWKASNWGERRRVDKRSSKGVVVAVKKVVHTR